jgi:hypothetical protein
MSVSQDTSSSGQTSQSQNSDGGSNQSKKKKNKSNQKKVCIITCVILAVLALLIGICVVASSLLFGGSLLAAFNFVVEEADEIEAQLVQPVCRESKMTLSEQDYKKYFSQDYRSKWTISDAEESLDTVFPSGYDCDDLDFEGFFEMLQKGFSVSVNYENGETTGSYGFTHDDGTYITLGLYKEEGIWKIDSITYTK